MRWLSLSEKQRRSVEYDLKTNEEVFQNSSNFFIGVFKVKTDTQSVKSKVNDETVHIGDAHFPVYDSLEEAGAEEGEEKCLDMINAQVRTNEMNRIRALAKGGPSKNRLRNIAIQEITGDEWQEIACDDAKIQAKVAEKVREIEARMALAPEAVAVED